MNTLSVVIPAYNEEGCIAEIIERVLAIPQALAASGVEELELIVVDDGSNDRTAEIAAGYDKVSLIRQPENRGYGAALKTGFSRAKGNLLGFLDADGTYPPEHFPDLCRVALDEKADLVIGSRMSGAESEMPMVRRIGNLFFANLVSLLSNVRVSDSASGMRVIRREALGKLYPLPDGLNFTPVMSTRATHDDINWREAPIPYKERVGRSKLSVVRDGTRFLYTILWTALLYNPVRILGGIGLSFVAIAAVISGIVFAMRLSGVTELGRWGVVAVYSASLSASIGVALFALGATFNYLVSLFHRRPIRQGLFGKPLFKKPLDQNFGWMGLVAVLVGAVFGIVSVILSVGGWPVERIWFYLLFAAMALVTGVQLSVSWVIMRVLAELSTIDESVNKDLQG
jgi:glycosyltransferase involved in cell wall biosynthesis